MKAAVPVLVTEEGRPLTGEQIYQYLHTLHSSQAACVFPRGHLGSQARQFYRKLEEVNVGILTYGLAFHTEQTKLLRFPYCREEFYEKVRAGL